MKLETIFKSAKQFPFLHAVLLLSAVNCCYHFDGMTRRAPQLLKLLHNYLYFSLTPRRPTIVTRQATEVAGRWVTIAHTNVVHSHSSLHLPATTPAAALPHHSANILCLTNEWVTYTLHQRRRHYR